MTNPNDASEQTAIEQSDIRLTRDEAEKERWDFITNFSSREKFAIDTSIQGSGKTYSGIKAFGHFPNTIFLAKSNNKLEEILERMQEQISTIPYHVVWGLEHSCTFYQDDREIQDQVEDLRKTGIDTAIIHRLIHPDDPNCPYLTQDRSYVGRTVQTFDRFIASIEHGLFNDFSNPRLIYLDEIDGFLDAKSVNIPTNEMFYEHRIEENNSHKPYEFKTIVQNDDYLPDISELIIPAGEKTILLERYRALITDKDGHISISKINENQYNIRLVLSKLTLVNSHYITGLRNNTKTGMTMITLMPSVFKLMIFLLRHKKLRFMAGSASLRHHRLKFKVLEGYFNFARSVVMIDYYNWIVNDNNLGNPRWADRLQRYEQVGNLTISEFRSSYIPQANYVYYMPTDRHSYSIAHYSRLLDGKNPTRLNKLQKELENEIYSVLSHPEVSTKILPDKVILIITFNTLIPFLRDLIAKKRHQSRNEGKGNYLRSVLEVLPWFSNKMHGINAQNIFDLVLLIGDPLENDISEYATKHNLLPDRMDKSGFALKPNLPEEVQRLVYESILTEFLEGIHRTRGEIPVIILGNFLNLRYGNHTRYKIISDILDKDWIRPMSLKTEKGFTVDIENKNQRTDY